MIKNTFVTYAVVHINILLECSGHIDIVINCCDLREECRDILTSVKAIVLTLIPA